MHNKTHPQHHHITAPHVERVERRVARRVGRRAVAAVRLVGVQLAALAHVVEALPRVALALLFVCVVLLLFFAFGGGLFEFRRHHQSKMPQQPHNTTTTNTKQHTLGAIQDAV